MAQKEQVIEDQRKKLLQKEKQLKTQKILVKTYERQDQSANAYQAYAQEIRQKYIEQNDMKDQTIATLETEIQILKEDNQKYRLRLDQFQEASKEARDRTRCSELKLGLEQTEDNITRLEVKRKDICKQLEEAQQERKSIRSAPGERSSKSRRLKENRTMIDKLDKELGAVKDALDKAESDADAYQAELDTLTSGTDTQEEFDPDLSHGSYSDALEESSSPIPDLMDDLSLSSRTSGSPPYAETMNTIIFSRPTPQKGYSSLKDDPWAYPVQASMELSPTRNTSAKPSSRTNSQTLD